MEQLANLADIELSQVYRIENGKINSKDITVIALATAVKTSVGVFFIKRRFIDNSQLAYAKIVALISCSISSLIGLVK
ncbi:MAG: hypothetical protein H7Y13_13090 [Sphingobacteriaceae bacterium]|nr:hypothetical protein [Sphingobacteriaceae bacterium]